MTYEGRNPSQYPEHTGAIYAVLCRYWLCKRKCIPLQETNNMKVYDCTFNRSSPKFTFNNRSKNTIRLFCPFVAPNHIFCVLFHHFSTVESFFRCNHIPAVHHPMAYLKGSDVNSVFHVSFLEVWTEFKCNVKLYNKIKTKFPWRSDNH